MILFSYNPAKIYQNSHLHLTMFNFFILNFIKSLVLIQYLYLLKRICMKIVNQVNSKLNLNIPSER